MTNVDFKTVVPAAQAEDKAAQDELMTKFYGWSVTQAKRVLRESEAAKDLAVDFWTWMFRDGGIKDFNADKGTFYAWMEMRIKSMAIDAIKEKPKVIYYSEVNDPDDWGENPADMLGALDDLEELTRRLSVTQQEVLWSLMEGETVAEIADEQEVSISRAKNLIGEVRAAITKARGE